MGFESRLYVLEPVTVQVFLLVGKIYFMLFFFFFDAFVYGTVLFSL